MTTTTSKDDGIDDKDDPNDVEKPPGFETLNLNPALLKAVEELGFQHPTPIQTKAIPPVLDGRDLIGCAQTGTGKTAAFLLPVMHRLMAGQKGGTRVLVLEPTRELAAQVEDSPQPNNANRDSRSDPQAEVCGRLAGLADGGRKSPEYEEPPSALAAVMQTLDADAKLAPQKHDACSDAKAIHRHQRLGAHEHPIEQRHCGNPADDEGDGPDPEAGSIDPPLEAEKERYEGCCELLTWHGSHLVFPIAA